MTGPPRTHPDEWEDGPPPAFEDAGDAGDVEMVSADVSCENCVHADVCQLFSAARRNVQQYEQDRQAESPVPPGVLAVRCDLFEFADDD